MASSLSPMPMPYQAYRHHRNSYSGMELQSNNPYRPSRHPSRNSFHSPAQEQHEELFFQPQTSYPQNDAPYQRSHSTGNIHHYQQPSSSTNAFTHYTPQRLEQEQTYDNNITTTPSIPQSLSPNLQPSISEPVPPPYSETPITSSTHLRKPIAIPATSSKLGSPFLRAYPPILNQYAIPQDEFLDFLDKLNRVAVASPPVKILGLAGNIVGFVPMATTQIVGGAINAAAAIATVAMSKGQTEILLRKTNKEIFTPRGLKVEIAKLDAVAKIAGIPILNAQGKIEKNQSLLDPLEDLMTTESTEQGEIAAPMSAQERRLQALEPWVEHLKITPLPEMQTPDNVWSKLHAGASERQRKKEEKDMMKGRKKAHKDYHKDSNKAREDLEKEFEKLNKEEAKIIKKETGSKQEKELAKVEKERGKKLKEYEKEMKKVEKDRRKEDKEEKGIRKILWIVIRNVEDPSGSGPNPDVDEDSG